MIIIQYSFHPLPSSYLAPRLVALLQNSYMAPSLMCVHRYLLSPDLNVSIKLPCVSMCLSSRDFLISSIRLSSFFSYILNHNFKYKNIRKTWKGKMKRNIDKIKGRMWHLCDTYVTRVCRHRWDRKSPVKIEEITGAFSQHCGFHQV
jgi:hypothetical protein